MTRKRKTAVLVLVAVLAILASERVFAEEYSDHSYNSSLSQLTFLYKVDSVYDLDYIYIHRNNMCETGFQTANQGPFDFSSWECARDGFIQYPRYDNPQIGGQGVGPAVHGPLTTPRQPKPDQIIEVFDHSRKNTKEPLTVTIRFHQPTPWTNTEDESITGPEISISRIATYDENGISPLILQTTPSPTQWETVHGSYMDNNGNLISTFPVGYKSITVNNETEPKTMTIVYDAGIFNPEGAAEGLEGVNFLGFLQLLWEDQIVPVGIYQSTMQIEYVMN